MRTRATATRAHLGQRSGVSGDEACILERCLVHAQLGARSGTRQARDVQLGALLQRSSEQPLSLGVLPAHSRSVA